MSKAFYAGGPAFPRPGYTDECFVPQVGMSLYAWLAATLPLTCHEDERIMKVFLNDSATAARRLEVLLRCLKARAMLEELAREELPLDTASGATVRDP